MTSNMLVKVFIDVVCENLSTPHHFHQYVTTEVSLQKNHAGEMPTWQQNRIVIVKSKLCMWKPRELSFKVHQTLFLPNTVLLCFCVHLKMSRLAVLTHYTSLYFKVCCKIQAQSSLEDTGSRSEWETERDRGRDRTRQSTKLAGEAGHKV